MSHPETACHIWNKSFLRVEDRTTNMNVIDPGRKDFRAVTGRKVSFLMMPEQFELLARADILVDGQGKTATFIKFNGLAGR